MLGLVAGIFATHMEHMAGASALIVAPLTMLAGTLYSVSLLPEPVLLISLFNPVFYLISGFVYAVTGRNEAAPVLMIVVTFVPAVVFTAICVQMIAVGYRLKN